MNIKKKTKLSQYKLITVYFSPTLICRSWTWGNTWDRCLVEIWGTPLFLCTHPSTSGSSEGCWIKPQKGKASTTEPLNYDKTPMFVWLYIFSCKPINVIDLENLMLQNGICRRTRLFSCKLLICKMLWRQW